jgi:hypothetical protein
MKSIFFAGLLLASILLVSDHALAQARPNTSDEFDLNIAEKRITETDFERSTAARLENGDLRLHVGAFVRAMRIDGVLRGVSGHVNFRVNLDDIRRRVNRLRDPNVDR